MVKENYSMINHIIALNNYSQNSQTESVNSKVSYFQQGNMTVLKCSPNKKPSSTYSSQALQTLSQNQYRNGHHAFSNRIIENSTICGVYEVYSNNLLEGSRMIRQLAKCSDIVAIDTEFPGVVCRINGEYSSTTSLSYHNIKCNTDLMKPIQIGFSFFNQNGEQSEINATVQFNLKWDMDNEIFAEDSILLLENSGIDFHEHKMHGIEAQDFAEIFLASGLPLNDKITWIGFHCAYDWAYMMKICTNLPDIPESYEEFSDLFLIYFPKTIDIKTIMTDKNLPKSGLQDLARTLHVERIGMQHQAGSDAKLTGDTFFSFYKAYCNGIIDEKYVNLIYGLNYCPTSGANMLWLPNQSPIPDEGDSTGCCDNTISVFQVASTSSAAICNSSINSGLGSGNHNQSAFLKHHHQLQHSKASGFHSLASNCNGLNSSSISTTPFVSQGSTNTMTSTTTTTTNSNSVELSDLYCYCYANYQNCYSTSSLDTLNHHSLSTGTDKKNNSISHNTDSKSLSTINRTSPYIGDGAQCHDSSKESVNGHSHYSINVKES